jgi:gliding motility-associated-like protein
MRKLLLGLFLCGQMALPAQIITCDQQFILTGTAVLQGECIRLTSNTTGQRGCAWFEEDIDFSMPFTHNMTVNFGSNNAGADGICLVYQNNSTAICGISGEGIGAQGIPNSFIVEFDTYQNGNLGDPINDHAAININGNFNGPVNGPFDLGNIEDGNDHTITFSWNPAGNNYVVIFDGAVILSGSYDIINNCFGGSPFGYWGYTSSTGGAFNEHRVCPGLPPEVNADASATASLVIPCPGATITLDGSLSDSGAEFTYEWTTPNGNIVSGEDTTTPLVDAPGTYTLTVYNSMTLCENSTQITITEDQLNADIDPPPYLDCLSGQVVLSGANSSGGNGITYEWTTPDGNIVATNGNQATVDQAGTYFLTVSYDYGSGTCTEETSVTVEEDPNVPVAFGLDEELSCDPNSIELDGTGSSEGSFSYQWSTNNGNILSGGNSLFPTVDEPGLYTIEVTNIFSGCTDSYDVYVTDNRDEPEALAFVDDFLGCGGSIVIDGSQSSAGNGITYQWSTVDGHIVGGADEASPEVDAPGSYTLYVYNTNSGCSAQTSVTVLGNNNTVDVTIAAPAALTCQTNSTLVTGSATPSSGVTYSWTTSNGLIVGPANQAQITAGAAGQYTLTATETATGCTGAATVTVASNNTPPIAEAGSAVPFGCGATSQQLNGSGSSTTNATYSWTTNDGQILTNANTLTPTVGSPGTYQLVVTNTTNECTATDQVVVPGDSAAPTVQILAADTLNCTRNSVVINATGSSSGAGYSSAWSTTNGQITGGQNGLQPTVAQAGVYTLTITNLNNGCSSTASVTVAQDTLAPLAQILAPDTLNCALTTLQLYATGSSQGSHISYQWGTTNGQLAGALDTLVASVNAPGTYTLLVQNTQNLCRDSASVVVVQNVALPVVAILAADTLTCGQLTAALTGTLAPPLPQATYLWTTTNGNLTGATNSLVSSASAPGTYQIFVTNTANQCSSTTTVTVAQNTTLPTAAAGPDQVLTCTNARSTLGGNGSSTGANIGYAWSSPNATITTTDTLANLAVAQAGTYVLLVTDANNQCTAHDTALVTADQLAPTAVVAPPPLLTCTDSLALLDGSASGGAPGLSFQWRTANGSLIGNTSMAQAQAGQAGSYQLVVTSTANGCTDTTQVTVAQDANFPMANIAPTLPLDCVRDSVVLQGTASSTSGNTTFSWSTPDGNIRAGGNTLQPTVDAAGTYLLQVIDGLNNCRAQASVQVVRNNTPPVAEAGTAAPFGCTTTSLQLNGNGSTSANATYQWSTSNGQIAAGMNTLQPTISSSGTYTLLVTDTSNNCTASDEIIVTADAAIPVVQIVGNDTLDCLTTSLLLDATASDSGAGFTLNWTTTDGAFASGQDGLSPMVTQGGTYTLEVTNTNNDCTNSAVITVVQDTVPPVVQLVSPAALTCSQTSVSLSAAGSSQGPAFTYNWTTSDGQISGATNSLVASATAVGSYTFTVVNTGNQCLAAASLAVTRNNTPPVANAAPAPILTCARQQLSLDGSLSDQGANFTYVWQTADGHILGDSTGLAPLVDAAGTYTLLVTNTDNDCTASAVTTVAIDTLAPTIQLAAPGVLTCRDTILTLDASASSGSPNLAYAWSHAGGAVITNAATPLPTITAGGDYTLTLTNTDNGCAQMTQLTVAVDRLPPVITLATPDTLDCQTPAVTLDATGSSGRALGFSWSTAAGSISANAATGNPTVAAAGSYTLVLTDGQNGCSTSASVAVVQDAAVPSIAFAPPATLTCLLTATPLDATASSSAAGLVYTWTTGNGQLISGTNSLSPVVGAPGVYTLTILDPANGCSNSANLTVSQDIQAPVAAAGADFDLNCAASSSLLNGQASSQGSGFTYLWTATGGQPIAAAQTLAPTITQTGTYVLEVTNTSNGCVDSDQVVVTQDVPVAVIEAVQPLCFGDRGAISFVSVQGGTPPYLYSINGGQSLQSQSFFTNLPPGPYASLVEDSNGCVYAAASDLIQPDSIQLYLGATDLELDLGDSIQLLVQTNYLPEDFTFIEWEGEGAFSCRDCLTPVVRPTESTRYRLRVATADGCAAEIFLRILVNKDFPVYIPTAFSPNGDGVNELFYIFSGQGKVARVRNLTIFNRWGNEVFFARDFPTNDPRYGWDGTVAGTPFNSAVFVYVAEIEFFDGHVAVFKGEVMLLK